LLQDKTFTDQLINRYQTLRQTILSLDHINAYIDSVVTLVNPIKDRHFDLWPIDKGYMTPESDPRSKSYEQEIAKLKHWIETRINWLDINIPKLQENVTTAIDNNKTGISTKIKFKAYPNPAISFINFESNRDLETIKIYNLRGQQVYSSKLETYKNINIQRFPKGLYFIKITFKNQKPITYKHLFL